MRKEEKIEFSKLSKKERREKAIEVLFGDFKKSEGGNIWGKKFSLFSLIGILTITIIAIAAVMTGKIDPQNLPEDESFFYQKKAEESKKNTLVKDTLN